MPRSPLFERIHTALRVAEVCEQEGLRTDEGVDRWVTIQHSRRAWLRRAGSGLIGLSGTTALARAQKPRANPRIAIVGAGLAGLVCADRLESKGYRAVLYEASEHPGGRCCSVRGFFPGQIAEAGGEFIDNGHKTMIALARRFGLTRVDVNRKAGDTAYHFFGESFSETAVVDQFRAVVARFRDDARRLSNAPSAFANNEADRALDQTDLATYFGTRAAGFPLVQAVLNEAYSAEYGLETSEQSALNFLLFMRLDKRSRFEPFGISDERFHLANGNDDIIAGLRAAIRSPLVLGARLVALARNPVGEYELTFSGMINPVRADFVVLALPFSTLRQVWLDPSLNLPAQQLSAIQNLGYGTNAKTMVGFNARVWALAYGSSGTAYSDLDNVQNTWETNRARAGQNAILTDYASAERGRTLDQQALGTQVNAFLADLDHVYPGIAAAATQVSGGPRAFRAHWPSDPNTLGSYTCYLPGQFTSVEGWTNQKAGALHFAGEHADSFYSWQGYMEGACLSGLRAADEVLASIKGKA